MATFSVIFAVVTVSLIIELIVMFLLLYGYILYRRLELRRHGIVMAGAVFAHLGAILGIMIPSFILAVVPEYILVHPFELTSIVSIFHEVTGGIALGLGLWFVASWRFRKNFAGCFGKRRAMLATLFIWGAALIFGTTLYVIFSQGLLMA